MPTDTFPGPALLGFAQSTPRYQVAAYAAIAPTRALDIQWEVPNGTGMVAGVSYRPVVLTTTVRATDLPQGTSLQGLTSVVVFGQGGLASMGTTHAFSASTVIQGNGDDLNEFCNFASFMRDDIGGSYTQQNIPGRMWSADLNMHGPVTPAQPNMIVGVSQFVNNYYNGSPIDGSYGLVVGTKNADGGGTDAVRQALDTYATDIGILVIGAAGSNATPHARSGFTRAIVVGTISGALDGPWNYGASRFDTGVEIRDWVNFAIDIPNRHADAAASAPAIVVRSGAGPVIVGGFQVVGGAAAALFEVQGTDATTDPLTMIGSVSFARAYRFEFRNSVGRPGLFVCGGAGDFLTGTAAGDGGMSPRTAGKSIHIGGTAKVLSVTQGDLFGAFAATPVGRQTITGSRGANAALASLLTGLANLGWVTDSTTV